MTKPQSPLDTFLQPLVALARKHPQIEGEVIWSTDPGWSAQDDAEAMLDAEEVPHYAEGLLLEGFGLQYQILAEAEAPTTPAHIRLFFWQTDAPPASPPPMPEPGLTLIAAQSWTP